MDISGRSEALFELRYHDSLCTGRDLDGEVEVGSDFVVDLIRYP